MKKLLSLMMALLLCLCMLLPAAAEAPVIPRAPLSLDEFQGCYANLFAAVLPGNEISWFSKEIDGQEAWGALMNDALPMAMLLMEDGRVSKIIVSFDGPLDEETVTVFIIQCSLVGGALLLAEGVPVQSAFDQATTTLADIISQTIPGNAFSVWGVDATYSCIKEDETNYNFLLVLNFNTK